MTGQIIDWTDCAKRLRELASDTAHAGYYVFTTPEGHAATCPACGEYVPPCHAHACYEGVGRTESLDAAGSA